MARGILCAIAFFKKHESKSIIHLAACLMLMACSGGNGNPDAHNVSFPRDPAPVISRASAPLETTDPAPLEMSDPAPLEVTDPAPLEVTDPAPLEMSDPAPLEVTDPAPLKVSDPAVLETSISVPIDAPRDESVDHVVIPPGHTVRIDSHLTQTMRDQLLPPTDLARSNWTKDAEYDANLAGFERVNVRAAYDKGATGYGVIVGIVDSFLETRHDEFANMLRNVENDRRVKITTADGESWLISVGHDAGISRTQSQLNRISHGTKVTGLIAARRDQSGHDRNMHGLAYESAVIFRSYHLRGDVPGLASARLLDVVERVGHGSVESAADLPDELNSLFELRDIALASAFMDVVNGGAQIVNASVGFGGSLFYLDAGAPGISDAYLSEKLPNIITALRSARGRAIIVFAAGNQRNSRREANSPILPYALQFYFEDLRDHVVTTVAVNPHTGHISTFSNRCGVAASWCIAAPGQSLSTPTLRQDEAVLLTDAYTRYFAGTSAAAPMVSGGLALLVDYFGLEKYTLADILHRLYDTADKNDYSADGGPDYSDSATYGQGMMDLGAAVQPFGATEVLLGSAISSARRFALSRSRIYAGAAFGDGLTLALSGRKAVFFDELDFAFEMDAGDYVVAASAANGLAARFARLGDEQSCEQCRIGQYRSGRFSLFAGSEPSAGIENLPAYSFFHLAEQMVYGGVRLSFGSHDFSSLLFMSGPQTASDEEEEITRAQGLGLSYHYGSDFAALGLDAGWVREPDGLLMSQFDGPFALGASGETLFFGFGGELRLSDLWRGFARGSVGWTAAARAASGGLSAMSDIVSSAWALGVDRRDVVRRRDRLSLIVSQPLRVERGEVDMHYVIGRRIDRTLISQTLRVPLAPSGRALDLEARYQLPLRWGRLTVAGGYQFQRGHNRGAKGDAWLLAQIAFRL